MRRRTLFGVGMGALVGLFVRTRPADAIDHTVPERDGNGKAICRVYRLAADGMYREIRRDQIRPGDRILMIGQDGDRLWKCEAVGVARMAPSVNGDAGGVVVDDSHPDQNLLAFEWSPESC